MTNNVGKNGRSFVRQSDMRTDGPRSVESAEDGASKRSIYTLVGVALVVIAVVGILSGPTMSRNVSDSAQVLRDTQSANEAIELAHEAVTHAVLTASEHEIGLASHGSVSAAVNQAEARLSSFSSVTARLPDGGESVTGADFVNAAHTVLRHIESGSSSTAEVFLTTRLQPINDELAVVLETKHALAVRGILEAEASAERTAVLAQTLMVFAVVASGLVVLLFKWKNVPVESRPGEVAVPYLRRVS